MEISTAKLIPPEVITCLSVGDFGAVEWQNYKACRPTRAYFIRELAIAENEIKLYQPTKFERPANTNVSLIPGNPFHEALARRNRAIHWLDGLQKMEDFINQEFPDTTLLPHQIGIFREMYERLENPFAGMETAEITEESVARPLQGILALGPGYGKTYIMKEFLRVTGLKALVLAHTRPQVKNIKEVMFEVQNKEVKAPNGFSNWGDQVEATTYAQAYQPQTGNFPQINPLHYDVLIADEQHNSMGRVTDRAMQRFAEKGVLEIGLSATPKARSESAIVLAQRSISEGVEEGALSSIRCYVVKTDMDVSDVGVNEVGDYVSKDLSKALINSGMFRVAAGLYADFYEQEKRLAKFMCNCESIADAIVAAKEFNQVLQERSVVDAKGKTPLVVPIWGAMNGNDANAEAFRLAYPEVVTYAEDREMTVTEAIFAMFNEGLIAGLAQVKYLREGYSNPELELIYNVAPTTSETVAIQRVRGTRSNIDAPDKICRVYDFLYKNAQFAPVLFHQVVGKALAVSPSHPAYGTEDVTRVGGHIHHPKTTVSAGSSTMPGSTRHTAVVITDFEEVMTIEAGTGIKEDLNQEDLARMIAGQFHISVSQAREELAKMLAAAASDPELATMVVDRRRPRNRYDISPEAKEVITRRIADRYASKTEGEKLLSTDDLVPMVKSATMASWGVEVSESTVKKWIQPIFSDYKMHKARNPLQPHPLDNIVAERGSYSGVLSGNAGRFVEAVLRIEFPPLFFDEHIYTFESSNQEFLLRDYMSMEEIRTFTGWDRPGLLKKLEELKAKFGPEFWEQNKIECEFRTPGARKPANYVSRHAVIELINLLEETNKLRIIARLKQVNFPARLIFAEV